MRNPPLFACVILLHTPPPGSAEAAHFDFLVDPPVPFPGADAGRLWTARVALPPAEWLQAGKFRLAETFPHRREYLTYEGQVAGNRGEVRRVAAGEAAILQWTPDAIALDLRLGSFAGRLKLRRIEGKDWSGEAEGKPVRSP